MSFEMGIFFNPQHTHPGKLGMKSPPRGQLPRHQVIVSVFSCVFLMVTVMSYPTVKAVSVILDGQMPAARRVVQVVVSVFYSLVIMAYMYVVIPNGYHAVS